MAMLRRLLTPGSMADSVGLYAGAVFFQRALGLGRVVLFTWLLAGAGAQWGLWAVASMIFTLGGPAVALGANQSLARYVAACQARGTLEPFYRMVRWRVPAVVAALTLAALAGADWLTAHVVVSHDEAAGLAYSQQRLICQWAILNAAGMGLFLSAVAFISGLRLYRLASLVEVFYGVAFTACGAGVLLVDRSATAILVVHAASLLAATAAGVALLHVALRQTPAPGGDVSMAAAAGVMGPEAQQDDVTAPLTAALAARPAAEPMPRLYRRFLGYGVTALAATSLWQGLGYVSFELVNRHSGKAVGGVFNLFLLLGQPVVYLANAAWAVIFSHVAKSWEDNRRAEAMASLETAYKAVTLVTSALALLLLAAGPLWVRLLAPEYRPGLAWLPGMTMFFLALNHLALMTILARLYEDPWVIALAAVVGGAINVVLCNLWLPTWGPAGAAWAGGVGLAAGGLAVSCFYCLARRIRLSPSTWLLQFAPLLLLVGVPLPAWAAALLWLPLFLAAALTTWFFPADQKRLLLRRLPLLSR